MYLYLSKPAPLNTAYTDEAGNVIYEVDTPRKYFGSPVATIKHTIRSTDRRPDRTEKLAEIEFHSLQSSIIRYEGRDIRTSDFFEKNFFSGSHVFKGPDGKEYKWKTETTKCKLFRNDKASTPIANFHQKQSGLFSEHRPASLEIFPLGEHMVDFIVVTFVYLEKLRLDSRRRSHHHHNSMAVTGVQAGAFNAATMGSNAF